MIVTIVTPTFNAVEYFRECIESARRNNSRGVEIEHVICDGGSTDGTIELAESYGLRVIKEKDEGIFDAVNKGSFNSSGELLGYLGADDVMLDGAAAAVAQAYKRSGRRWVVGGTRFIDERGRSLGELAAPPTWMTPRMYACLGWSSIVQMSAFLSRGLFNELEGYNVKYEYAGDYEMFARALSIAPYERLPQALSCFRRTGKNHSVVNGERVVRECQQALARFGPQIKAERWFWRAAMKSWVNFTNPRWLAFKLTEPARLRLGLEERVYF